MKTNVRKHIPNSTLWLPFFLLLLLINISIARATDRDSLQKAHIAASIQLLNKSITHNTLKKPAAATRYLVDRLNYVSSDARDKIEKVLEYLKQNTNKELYVIITRSPDMVNEENAAAKFQQETKGFTDEVYARSLLGANGVLVTINFLKSTTRKKIGVKTTYLQGTGITAGNELAQNAINQSSFRTTLQNEVKNTKSPDDLAKAIIYQIHQKVGDILPELNLQVATVEKLTEYEERLGLKNSEEIDVTLHTIIEIPEESFRSEDASNGNEPEYEGAMTPSGIPISVAGMQKNSLKFWNGCNGALIKFTSKSNVKYVAVISRSGSTTLCHNQAKFWGYYPAEYMNGLYNLADKKPSEYYLIKGGELNPKVFIKKYWYPTTNIVLDKGARIRAQLVRKPYLNSPYLNDAESSGFWDILKDLKILKSTCREDIYWDNEREKNSNQSNIIGTVEKYNFDTDNNRTTRLRGGCDLSQILAKVEQAGVVPGWGTLVYLKHYKTKNVDRKELKEFANMISRLIGKDESLMLVDFENEFNTTGTKHTNGRPELAIKEILRLGYKSKEEFDEGKAYVQLPYKIRNAFNNKKYTVWATYDPWKGNQKLNVPAIPVGYNYQSRDFTIKGRKVAYHYSVQDLIGRHTLVKGGNSDFKIAILLGESQGKALPISAKDGAEQLKALFGSNSAVFSMAMFVGVTLGNSAKLPFELMESFGRDVSKFIEKHFVIPEYWWNPACAGGGKRAPGEVNCQKCVQAYSMAAGTIFRDKISRTNFAFMAGIYNGIVGQISGIFKMAHFIGGYVSNPKVREALRQSINRLKEKGILQALLDIYKKETCNVYVASYYAGKHFIDLLALVLGAKSISTVAQDAKAVMTKIGNLAKSGALKAFKGTERVVARITKYVTYTAQQPVKLLLKSSKEGGKTVYKVLVKSNRGERTVAMIRNDGTVRAFETATRNLKTAKAHILKTEKQLNNWLDQLFGKNNGPTAGGSLAVANGDIRQIRNIDFRQSIYKPKLPGNSLPVLSMYGRYASYGKSGQTLVEVDEILKRLDDRLAQLKKAGFIREMKKAYQEFQNTVTYMKSGKMSISAGAAKMEKLLIDYQKNGNYYQKLVAQDIIEADQLLGIDDWYEIVSYVATKNVKGNILHKNGLKYKLRPHFEDIKTNLQLKGLPNEIVNYRNKKGIYREPMGNLAKEGGAVAASKAELFVNGKTYNTKIVYGASIEARIKPGNAAATRAERAKIRSKYIAINKKQKQPVANKQSTDHAEQDNLGNLSDEIDKVVNSTGVTKVNLKGKVYMHVDRAVCEQCTANIFSKKNTTKGPIYLFSEEYPNLEIYITNGEVPNFVLKVKGGSQF